MQGTKERILASAIRLVSERGWSASISEIARDAGVSEQTVYRRFKNRDALLADLLAEASRINPMVPYLEAALNGKPTPALQEVMGDLVTISVGPAANLYRLVFHAALDRPEWMAEWDRNPHRKHTLGLLEAYVARLQALGMFTPALPSLDAGRALHGLLMGSFCRNVIIRDSENSDPDPVAAMRKFCELLATIP